MIDALKNLADYQSVSEEALAAFALRLLDAACARAMGYEVKWHHSQVTAGMLYIEPEETQYTTYQPLYEIGRGHLAWDAEKWVLVPFYSTDPTAARVLESEIERRGLLWEYLKALSDLCGADVWEPGDVQVVSASELWKLIRATPEQRARAFVEATKGQQSNAKSS